MFLVDADSPGVQVASETVTMLGDVTCEFALDDVVVPASNMIGEEGDGANP